jgi:heptaprenylglyceryl phosphate synthase
VGTPGLRVLDPGEVRSALLDYRIIMAGGISIDLARSMLTMLRADLVVAGRVRSYDDEAVQARIVSLVHLSHSSGAESFQDAVMGNRAAGQSL